MEELRITAEAGRNGARILRLHGPLEVRSLSVLQTIAREESAALLILDFSGVPYVDSAGLGAVLGLFVSARRKNLGFAIAGVLSDRVRVLFQATHLRDFLPSFATVDEAEAALGQEQRAQ